MMRQSRLHHDAQSGGQQASRARVQHQVRNTHYVTLRQTQLIFTHTMVHAVTTVTSRPRSQSSQHFIPRSNTCSSNAQITNGRKNKHPKFTPLLVKQTTHHINEIHFYCSEKCNRLESCVENRASTWNIWCNNYHSFSMKEYATLHPLRTSSRFINWLFNGRSTQKGQSVLTAGRETGSGGYG